MKNLLACAILVWCSASPAAAQSPEPLDGIAAVVNGSVYTRSDVRAVRALHLLDLAPSASDLAVTRALVDRRLELEEAARSAIPDPSADAVAQRRRDWSATLPSGTDIAQVLRLRGWTDDDLTAWLREDVRLQNYLDRLFSASAQPTASELAAYLREHEAEVSAKGARGSDEVDAAARRQLTQDNRRKRVQDWIDGLKRRADISIKIG